MLKEIDLQRFNLHYTLEVAKQGRWKGWRYAFFQEANTGLNLAGGIISIDNRGSNLHHAAGVRLHPQEAANYIPMIGSIIGAGAAVGELGINSYHDMMARKHGFSPASSIKHVKGLKDAITRLMAERQDLIKIEESDPAMINHVLIDNAEGKVLQDTLDQSLQEFARYHVGACKLLAFQQMQYLFDASKYTTSAIGSEFAYLSLSQGKRIWNGRAGVLFAVSGQLTIWGPVLSRLFAKGVGKLTKRRMEPLMREADEAKIATLQADLKTLDDLIQQGVPTNPRVAVATERQAMFNAHERTFAKEISAEEKKENAAKLAATQNIAAGAFMGGSKTASAVLFLVPGFNPNYNSKTARAGRVTNDLLFTSAVVGLPANAFSMLDTLRIQVKGEINRHSAAKKGELPGQLAAARLKELDLMERKLKSM
ncbi:MAG: hypothetical protein IT342_01380 [Candidatus Melainabacteria bacterium]|nr:hypothetical protein [Candidatus Melainabacteria bacterium]